MIFPRRGAVRTENGHFASHLPRSKGDSFFPHLLGPAPQVETKSNRRAAYIGAAGPLYFTPHNNNGKDAQQQRGGLTIFPSQPRKPGSAILKITYTGKNTGGWRADYNLDPQAKKKGNTSKNHPADQTDLPRTCINTSYIYTSYSVSLHALP